MITVYTITQDGVVRYVGKTKDYTRRKLEHQNRRGTSLSAIPTDVNLSTVEFHPIATFETNDEALKFEDEIILKYDTINNGWNKNRSGHICEDKKAWGKQYYLCKKQEILEYHQTPERKARHRECDRQYYLRKKQEILEYHQTLEYKARHRECQRQYRLRKKKERAAV